MENLDEALAQLINTALNGLDSSVGFLQAELPDVISQLLIWHGARSGVFFVLGVILMFVWVPIALRIVKGFKPYPQEKDKERSRGDHISEFMVVDHGYSGKAVTVPGIICCIAGGFISFISFLISTNLLNLEWLQIWIAPKVWLLEYAAALVK